MNFASRIADPGHPTVGRLRAILVLAAALVCAWLPAVAQSSPAPAQDQQSRDLKEVPSGSAAPLANPVTLPHSYALVIGIAHYANLPAKAQLQFPARDAQDVYSALISQTAGQFPPENVHTLIDGQATLANIRHELEDWLPAVTRPQDRVLIYFAGHGFLSNGVAYLAPYDLDPARIAATAYPMDRLGQTIGARIQGKWKVLLTDACHSGAISPGEDLAAVNRSLLDLNASLFSLTASRDREQSFESPQWGGGHGIFTYYVIRGLDGEADTNGDGIVTADELAEYVRENVRVATGTRQNPTADRGSFDPQMVLAYNPGGSTAQCGTPGCLPAARYGTFVIEANMDDTEVWLDGKSLGVFRKGAPQRFPGLAPGPHTIKATHQGYQPDGPREVLVYPGQDTAVNVRILIARQHDHAAEAPFERGLERYNLGYAANYRLAATDFEEALRLDPQYTQAALYLGRTQQVLGDENAARQSLERAVALDPDRMEARLGLASVLLDVGDLDEAVRQLTVVSQREPGNGMAWYLLSQAYAREGAYPQAVSAGRTAITLTPANAEAHLWLAEALRMSEQCGAARTQYETYLSLSRFNSQLGGKLDYYVLGSLIGLGSKKRATQGDIWRELRSQAYVGICDCEWLGGQYEQAALSCRMGLALTPHDLFANYRMGLIFAQEYNAHGDGALLVEARKYFNAVLSINPDADEAGRSRKYLANIDTVLAQSPRR
jgi:tetratricopeptide (TPR) repeat protein